MNYQQVRAIPIPLPPVTEQHAIAAQLVALDSKLRAEEQRQRVINILFNTLLHDLMTGKRRVADGTVPEAVAVA